MAEPALILAFDVPSKALISFNGSPSTFNTLKRGVYLTHIYLRKKDVDSLPGISVETTAFDATSIDGIRAGFWSDSPGTDLNELTLTDQTGWTPTTDENGEPVFEGYLNLMDDRIVTWLGAASCASCFFAVATVLGQNLTPIYDYTTCDTENFEIQRQTDPGSGNGVITTLGTTRIRGPVEIIFASGNIYSITEQSPGVVDAFTWVNPP